MRSLRSFAKPTAPLVVLGAAMWLATPAFAHIQTDPAAVEAGKAATVGFIVEHGCAGSPTTGVDIQLPVGSKDVSGVDGAGFTSTPRTAKPSLSPAPILEVTDGVPASADETPEHDHGAALYLRSRKGNRIAHVVEPDRAP